MADDWYDNINRKLVEIENKVFGKADKDADYPQFINTLTDLHTNIQVIVKNKEKLSQVFTLLPVVEKMIDPQFSDMVLSQSAKLELVLTQEEFINNCVSQLQQVSELKTVFESQHIQAVPGIADRIQTLNKIQLQQEKETSDQSKEVDNLFNEYNHLINTVSKQLIQWDKLITELEIKSQIKKPLD